MEGVGDWSVGSGFSFHARSSSLPSRPSQWLSPSRICTRTTKFAFVTAGVSAPPHDGPHSLPIENKSKACDSAQIIDYAKGGVDQSGKSCELKFGSYCLWREQHREDVKDTMVKRLKDELFVARAYFPSIAKLPSQDKMSCELRQNIQEVERVLSESTTDVDLPPQYARLGTNTISYI